MSTEFVFLTEKQIEERLIEEVRLIKMPDGSHKYVRMRKVGWNALEWLTEPPLNTCMDNLIRNTQKWANKYGYSFEEYFPQYIAWFYKGVISD